MTSNLKYELVSSGMCRKAVGTDWMGRPIYCDRPAFALFSGSKRSVKIRLCKHHLEEYMDVAENVRQ